MCQAYLATVRSPRGFFIKISSKISADSPLRAIPHRRIFSSPQYTRGISGSRTKRELGLCRSYGISSITGRRSGLISAAIALFLAAKWLQEQLIEPQLPRIAKLRDANRHRLMSIDGLGAVSAKQSVPPRQIEAEIAVGLLSADRMMHPVHLRGHDEPAEPSFQPSRDAD